ncbi:MAG TPA: sigma-70 family RNA polymerase sigma factor [Thermoanaerobaculia bacterium]|nr:sigma-70 family RNA polymerase sigma factor [Thermoanaerobaculia bacterium]
MPESSGPGPYRDGRFATTSWSLVLAAGGASATTTAAGEALATLCSRYWYPVFAFVRRQGYPPEDARDLTQGFFTRVIEKGDVGDADRSRGRFRTFLLSACSHFLSNERDRAGALKRGGGFVAVPLDLIEAEGRYERALASDETPERLYDRQWALALLSSCLESLRTEYEIAGQRRLFERLEGYLTAEDATGAYAEAAVELGMTTSAVKTAVHRLRRRYRDALLRHIADTLSSSDDGDDELRHLLEALSR